jgi:hypothetical protein
MSTYPPTTGVQTYLGYTQVSNQAADLEARFGLNAVANVKDPAYGAKGDGVTDDTAAFIAARTARPFVYMPAGAYNIHGLDLSQFVDGAGFTLRGESRENVTIVGNGDIFTNVGTGQGRVRFSDFSINQTGFTAGKLFSANPSISTQRTAFVNIDFGACNYHIFNATGNNATVDWSFDGCRFQGALSTSRYIAYATGWREVGCYTAGNAEGVRVLAGYGYRFGGVFEEQSGYAINLLMSNATIGGIFGVDISAYFEHNANAAPGTADVNVECAAVGRIRNVNFNNTQFNRSASGVNYSVRLANNAGNVQRTVFHNVYSQAPNLCTSGYGVTVENVEMQSGAYPTDALIMEPTRGTYVPTVTLGGGTCTLEPTTYETLQYTKTGPVVHIQGHLRLSAVSSPSGTVAISLPFAPATGTQSSAQAAGSITINGMVNTWTGAPQLVMLAGVQAVNLYELVAGSYANPGAKLAANADIILSLTYETNS